MTPISTIRSGTAQNLESIRRSLIQILAIVSILRIIFPGTVFFLTFQPDIPLAQVIIGVFVIATLYAICFGLSLTGSTNLASYGLITIYFILNLTPFSLERFDPIITIVIITTLIQDWRLFVALNVVLFSIVTSKALFISMSEGEIFNLLYIITSMGVIAITIRFFVNSIQQTLISAERSSNLLRIGAEVGQITAGLSSVSDLLTNSVEFIRDRFAFYHVQIFMLDETGKVAILQASTGDVGQKLLERKHQLNVGSSSVIGRVTKSGEPVIARDTDRSNIHYRNELLPNTRAELALPIKDGDTIIGALDVQSTRANAFEARDVQALAIMTNLLASSIRNAKLFEEQRLNVQENQRLYIAAESNLREIQRLNSQLTKESWDQYTDELGQETSVILEGNRIIRGGEWSNIAHQAEQTRQPISDRKNEQLTVAVPIILRGEVIGAMEIEPDSSTDENDALEVMRAVSERLAISLDNARLFEESRETTQIEQRINAIVNQYQQTNSLDELLQITLKELSTTLGAEAGAIRLTGISENSDTTPLNMNGNI